MALTLGTHLFGQLRFAKAAIYVFFGGGTAHRSFRHIRNEPFVMVGHGRSDETVRVLTRSGVGESFFGSVLAHSVACSPS